MKHLKLKLKKGCELPAGHAQAPWKPGDTKSLPWPIAEHLQRELVDHFDVIGTAESAVAVPTESAPDVYVGRDSADK